MELNTDKKVFVGSLEMQLVGSPINVLGNDYSRYSLKELEEVHIQLLTIGGREMRMQYGDMGDENTYKNNLSPIKPAMAQSYFYRLDPNNDLLKKTFLKDVFDPNKIKFFQNIFQVLDIINMLFSNFFENYFYCDSTLILFPFKNYNNDHAVASITKWYSTPHFFTSSFDDTGFFTSNKIPMPEKTFREWYGYSKENLLITLPE